MEGVDGQFGLSGRIARVCCRDLAIGVLPVLDPVYSSIRYRIALVLFGSVR